MSIHVLITGYNSYIGDSIRNYLQHFSQFSVDVLDVRNPEWINRDFSCYDTVIDVAGIAHIKESEDNKASYYLVNRDLAVSIATKAKDCNVKKFIYFSSMSVYGLNSGTITLDTLPNPVTHYGKSKIEAEQLLRKMASNSFSVIIIRPPMVYGKDCKGNFQTIKRIVELSPVFPKVNNQRSMIYIDNLCEFIRCCIVAGETGVYFPQNSEYMNTTVLAVYIASGLGKKIHVSRIIGWLVERFIPSVTLIEKAFGSLVYNIPSASIENYNICEIKESIIKSV